MTQSAAATAPGERVQLLDVLRGFALFGVLLVNVQYFVEPDYVTVMAQHGWGAADRLGIWLVELLAFSKFYPIFSFLFGYGAALQLASAARRSDRFVAFYAWRMALLLAIGAAHQTLVWDGDILATYALLGFALLLFHTASGRALVAWATLLTFAVTLTLTALRLWLDLADPPAETAAALQTRFAELADPWRRVARQTCRVMAMFVLGFWAGRQGSSPTRRRRDPSAWPASRTCACSWAW